VPTVLRSGPYRIFFFAGDRNEPKHVHIEREDKVAKFWLEPVRLHEGGGFSRPELLRLHALVRTNAEQLLEAWNAYFAS
jgi:hypothetical protein